MNTQGNAEILSAFLDGERVDPADLAAALTEPGAREALVDFVLLRAAVAAGDELPSESFYDRSRNLLRGHRPRPSLRQAIAAAALIAAGGLAVWSGERLLGGLPAAENAVTAGPPPADRQLTFEPGVEWHPRSGR